MSEVRLIDANALKRDFAEFCASECPICSFYIPNANVGDCYCGLIDSAPTVTPDMAQVLAYESGKASADRPTGKWKIGGKTTHYHYCSICGKDGDFQDNFCRNCGARMGKTENE